MKYNYENLIEDLQQGREIEFSYKDKDYAIVNHANYWFLIFSDVKLQVPLCKFEDKQKLTELVGLIAVEDVNLEKIFNKKLYDENSLYIL
ncbi:hypothetical protein [Abyssisolibacter fermentans]|uniref:hypothetical protein n=1 Tax=Abyssisolibacter fermentans TaxID=1766203 RepID=UPI0008340960|nr:hypothetical protein [Abyssisolibacter fermentans]